MKNTIFTLFLFLISIPLLAQEAEKKAIIKVIEGEHLAHCSRDFDKFASYYDQNENVIWGDGIRYSLKGWKEVEELLKPHYKENPSPEVPLVFYNYQISIADKKAWVTFDTKNKGGSNPVFKQQRILVKQKGEWKLVAMLFFPIN